MPSKCALTGGAFQDSEGNPLALGYLEFVLSQDCSVAGVGNIASGITITIALDANGNVSPSPGAAIWGNDVLNPQPNFYRVTGYTAAGQPAWGPNNQQVTGAGFNLGTWVPNAVISWSPTVGQPITLEHNGVANSSQTLLNLESTDASVTITDVGGGTLNLQAAAAGPTGLTPGSVLWLPQNQSTPTWVLVGDVFLSADSGATPAFVAPTSSANAAFSQTGSRNYIGTPLAYGGRNATFKSVATFTRGTDTFSIAFVGLTSDIVWDGYPFTNLTTAQAGFQIKAADTTWHAIVGNGASVTEVDTGIAFGARHTLEIDYTPTSVVFKIDGATVATISTTLPTTSSLAVAILSNRGLGSSAPILSAEYLSNTFVTV